MNPQLIYYIGLAGIEGGVCLGLGFYFCLSRMEGRKFRAYTSAMYFVLFMSMLMDIYTATQVNCYGRNDFLERLDELMYILVIPPSAAIALSIIMPHKSTRWTLRFLLLSQVGAWGVIQAFIFQKDLLTYNVAWLATILYCAVLTVYCMIRLKRYETALNNIYSDTEGRSVSWIHRIIMLFMVALVFYFVAIGSDERLWETIGFIVDIVTLITASYYIGKQKPVSENVALQLRLWEQHPEISNPAKAPLDNTEEALEMTEKFNMIAKNLKRLFEDKQMFLKAEITSSEAAKAIGTDERHLSYFLGSVMDRNFNSYVRELRVDYAKRLLESHHDLQLTEIAMRSGFNSPATFGFAFKTAYGVSPKAYQKEYLGKTGDMKTGDNQTGDIQTGDIQTEDIQTGDIQTGDIQTGDIETGGRRTRKPQYYDQLNAREKTLCKLVIQGLSTAEIAAQMNISREGLRVAKSRLLKKLDPSGQYHDLKACLTEQ